MWSWPSGPRPPAPPSTHTGRAHCTMSGRVARGHLQPRSVARQDSLVGRVLRKVCRLHEPHQQLRGVDMVSGRAVPPSQQRRRQEHQPTPTSGQRHHDSAAAATKGRLITLRVVGLWHLVSSAVTIGVARWCEGPMVCTTWQMNAAPTSSLFILMSWITCCLQHLGPPSHARDRFRSRRLAQTACTTAIVLSALAIAGRRRARRAVPTPCVGPARDRIDPQN
jgi:hypothetical protein